LAAARIGRFIDERRLLRNGFPMTVRSLKVGIISANWGVKCHLPAWRAVEGVEVLAICTSREVSARAAAEANGIPRAYWDYRKLVADPDIDVIDVGTRPSLRYHMLKAALAAGKHVYAGVPFAVNAAQAEELVHLADAMGLKGASDAYFEYIPAHRELKQRLARGEIGEFYSAALDIQINLFNPPVPDFSYLWFADKANGASALRNLGSHAITLLTALFGEIREVVGIQATNLAAWQVPGVGLVRPQVPDTAAVLAQFRRGGTATINVSWVAAGGVGWRLDVQGSKGRLSAVHVARFPNSDPVKLYAASASTPFGEDIPVSRDCTHATHVRIDHEFRPLPSYPMALSFHELKRAIEGLGDASPSLGRALHVERVIEAIARSEHSGKWEAVPRPDPSVQLK
jgi:predicted dehydrogenase